MAIIVVAYLTAAISAIPVLRPWEYFNEFAGGSKNAYRYFTDEGVDLGQRTKELAKYCRQHLNSGRELPEILYFASKPELKARRVDYLGKDMNRDFALTSRPERKGTIIVSPVFLIPKAYWDRAVLRNAEPVARFGNLFIYSGEFYLPGNAADILEWYAKSKLFAEKPDLEEAEKAFRTAAKLDPAAYFVNVELGNVCLSRGKRAEALEANREALANVRGDQVTKHALEEQIKLISSGDLTKITPVRDPMLE